MAPKPVLHAAVLGGTLLLLTIAFPLAPERARIWVMLLAGLSAAATLGAFALLHQLELRRRIGRRGEPTAGAIRERPRSDGGVVLELPGQGLEPWGSDAWAVLLLTLTLAGISSALDAATWALFAFVLALIAILGLRLYAAGRDFIRIEIEDDGWSIDALEGGRTVHVTGRAPLLPELLPEALLLWSDKGRIGTIRWELAPEERAWLAARLLWLAEHRESLGEAGNQMDQPEPHDDGQQQETEQAK
jgi:hypothetical protein